MAKFGHLPRKNANLARNKSFWFAACRRIFNLYQRKFWHGWSVKWNCLYENIAGFPFLTTNALVIKEESTKVNQ